MLLVVTYASLDRYFLETTRSKTFSILKKPVGTYEKTIVNLHW